MRRVKRTKVLCPGSAALFSFCSRPSRVSNRDPLLLGIRPGISRFARLVVRHCLLRARLPLQSALFGRATDLDGPAGARDAAALGEAWHGRGGDAVVADVLRDRVFAADVARVDTVALAGLLHGVVAAVEVFALLEGLAEVVGAVGEFAVEAEEPLLLGGEGL